MPTFRLILVVALIFAFLLQGGVNRLILCRVPRKVAVVVVFLLFVGIFSAVLVVLLPLIGRQALNLANKVPIMFEQWQSMLLVLSEQFPEIFSASQIKDILSQTSKELGGITQHLVSFSLNTFPDILALILYTILVPLLVFLMLQNKPSRF